LVWSILSASKLFSFVLPPWCKAILPRER
jgi:hypothetical protein